MCSTRTAFNPFLWNAFCLNSFKLGLLQKCSDQRHFITIQKKIIFAKPVWNTFNRSKFEVTCQQIYFKYIYKKTFNSTYLKQVTNAFQISSKLIWKNMFIQTCFALDFFLIGLRLDDSYHWDRRKFLLLFRDQEIFNREIRPEAFKCKRLHRRKSFGKIMQPTVRWRAHLAEEPSKSISPTCRPASSFPQEIAKRILVLRISVLFETFL